MKTVRAKFHVTAKEETLHDQKKLVTVKLSPVGPQFEKDPVSGTWNMIAGENTAFWKASPTGEIRLGCINLDAANSFELGKDYFVDFTPAFTATPAGVASVPAA